MAKLAYKVYTATKRLEDAIGFLNRNIANGAFASEQSLLRAQGRLAGLQQALRFYEDSTYDALNALKNAEAA